MKKFVSLFLALLLLSAIPAGAEGLYIRQVPQYTYFSTLLITPESYPEARVAPNYASSYFTDYNPAEPMFLCFPGPDGAAVTSFDVDEVSYLDDTDAIQYYYQARSSDSWEEFLNKAEDDSRIVLDGSDNMAAYIDPGRLSAYGMVGIDGFGKSAKMIITMRLDSLSSKMPEDTIVSALTEAIVSEVQRVNGQMRYETFDMFWNNGEYAGIKMLDSDDHDYLLKLDFPSLSVALEDGTVAQADLIVTGLRYNTVYGVYNYGNGAYVQAQISALEDNPFSLYKLEGNDPDAQEVTLDNGSVWTVYANGLTERGKSSYVYAAKPLGRTNKYEKELYLDVKLDGEDVVWTDIDGFMADLAPFDACYEAMSAGDDPYVPAEQPASEDDGWTCSNGHAGNTGKFCPECGEARPEAEEDAAA